MSAAVFPEGLRVLAVDADTAFLHQLETLLKQCKYEVWTCNSANKAWEMLGEKNEKFKFDVVMTDVNMDDMDGFDFLQHAAQDFEVPIPVIMMTEDGETDKVMKGVLYGACDHLLKPLVARDVEYIWKHVLILNKTRAIEEGRLVMTPQLEDKYYEAYQHDSAGR